MLDKQSHLFETNLWLFLLQKILRILLRFDGLKTGDTQYGLVVETSLNGDKRVRLYAINLTKENYMSDMLSWAQLYRTMGLSVIPVREKIPLIKWAKYQEVRASEEEIKTWWTQWPNADIGMVTGPISGRLVLDIDGQDGLQNVHRNAVGGNESCNLRVKTRRGFQYHYRWPNGLTAKSTVAGIFTEVDVRGEGGYVKMPPSLCSDGTRYEWLSDISTPLSDTPKWLIDKLTEKPPFTPNVTGSLQEPWIEELLQGVPVGKQHQSLVKLAGYYFNHFSPEVAIIHLREWDKKNIPPMEPQDFENQLADLKARFAKGEYKSNYKAPEEPVKLISFKTDVNSYLAELKTRSQHIKPEFSTGYSSLDRLTRGFPKQNLYVIGAPTNGGKTQFVLSCIHSLLEQGKRVLYFSTEMPQNEIADRFNAIGAKIPLKELRDGFVSAASKEKLIKFLSSVNTENFIISAEDTPTLESVEHAIEKSSPDIVIFDHIHHIKMGSENRRFAVDEFVMGLKKLVLKHDIPCVVTAQLRRKEAIDGKINYTMHDFKESGGIENEAGVCLLLCPPEQWTTDRFQHVTAYLPKNRHGRREVRFSLEFDTEICEFKEPTIL
jgi:KaiC/GvpD/RAD55 family RecA-like ATPase